VSDNKKLVINTSELATLIDKRGTMADTSPPCDHSMCPAADLRIAPSLEQITSTLELL